MQVTKSIQKARERGINDENILKEIEKQNPDKKVFFEKARERGASDTKILDEIIKQNPIKSAPSDEKEKTAPSSPTKTATPEENTIKATSEKETTPSSASLNKKTISGNSDGKTLLTREAQEAEEEMRKQFLKRIEAKERGESVDGGDFFSPQTPPGENIENTSKEMTENETTGKAKKNTLLFAVVGVLVVVSLILFMFVFLQ